MVGTVAQWEWILRIPIFRSLFAIVAAFGKTARDLRSVIGLEILRAIILPSMPSVARPGPQIIKDRLPDLEGKDKGDVVGVRAELLGFGVFAFVASRALERKHLDVYSSPPYLAYLSYDEGFRKDGKLGEYVGYLDSRHRL